MSLLGPLLLGAFLLALAIVGLMLALAMARAASRPHPAAPVNCGDCRFMVPRARVYKRETLEDADGIVPYLCQQRWIEVTPVSPRCSLGKSRTLVTREPA